MTEDEKLSLNIVNHLYKRYKNRVIWYLLLLIIGIPILISILYSIGRCSPIIHSEYSQNEILIYWGAILSFIGTIGLGSVALLQNQLIREENRKIREIEEFKKYRTIILKPRKTEIINFYRFDSKEYDQDSVKEILDFRQFSILVTSKGKIKYYAYSISLPFLFVNEIPERYYIDTMSLIFSKITNPKEIIKPILFINYDKSDYLIETTETDKIVTQILLFIEKDDPQKNILFSKDYILRECWFSITFTTLFFINTKCYCRYVLDKEHDKYLLNEDGYIRIVEVYKNKEIRKE